VCFPSRVLDKTVQSAMTTHTRFRLSVVALFVDGDSVLLLHQMTPPEPDCWDLPGGGLEPAEDLMGGLRREVREEIGLQEFQIVRLLTIAEAFYPEAQGRQLHKLDIIYQCRVEPKPTTFETFDTQEIGPKGICWLPTPDLQEKECSSRLWKALQAAGLVPLAKGDRLAEGL
jgi:8-oxo-dGTP diphosphatase